MTARIETEKQTPTVINNAISDWFEDEHSSEYLIIRKSDGITELAKSGEDYIIHDEDNPIDYSVSVDTESSNTSYIVKPEANPLEQHVIDWINETTSENVYGNTPKDVVSTLMAKSCDSGMTTHLLRHTETYQFVIDYRFEVEEIISEIYEDKIPSQLLDDGWAIFYDKLAWIAFEETARRLLSEIYPCDF